MFLTILEVIFSLLAILFVYLAVKLYFGERDKDENPEKLTRRIFWLFLTSMVLFFIIFILELMDDYIFNKDINNKLSKISIPKTA